MQFQCNARFKHPPPAICLQLFTSIMCVISERLIMNLPSEEGDSEVGLPERCKTQVADDLVKRFSDSDFSDVLVESDGQTFKCH